MFKRMIFKNNKTLNNILNKIKEIRKVSDFLVLCPGTTGYSWMGVNHATFATFNKQTVELPQYYSNTIFSENELKNIIITISSLNFNQIILSGFPKYFSYLAKELYNSNNKIKVLYHGFFSELSNNELQEIQLKNLIDYSKKGIIHSIGFNKKGMAETINLIYGIRTIKVLLRTPLLQKKSNIINHQRIRIGVLGNIQFRKNIHNQIFAAATIPNAEIHITSKNIFQYLPENIPLIGHSCVTSHDKFLELLGSMNINLHLSYSESWGLLTTESLSMGIPCLIAYHSDVYDYDEKLKKLFIVDDYDNTWAIRERILEIISIPNLSVVCRNYIHMLNQLSDESIQSFLNL